MEGGKVNSRWWKHVAATRSSMPAHHQLLARLLCNGDRDDMEVRGQVPPWWRPRNATRRARLNQLRHMYKDAESVRIYMFSLAEVWRRWLLKSSMQRPPLTHLPAVMTHTEAAVCALSVCVCLCVSERWVVSCWGVNWVVAYIGWCGW